MSCRFDLRFRVNPAYSKFVEFAAKATASIDSKAEAVRRENVSIEEVRRIPVEILGSP